jgi:hypothetical protein
MDILQETKEVHKKTFFNHVFSMTDEGKAEVFNVLQYVLLAVIPVVVLNKLIQRFIPEADIDKSSLELLVEIFIQLIIMFCGIIVIHRIITYIPTYSGFKYESLTLTSVILAFLIIVLSIQTKLGIKVNLLVDRLSDLWNGSDSTATKKKGAKRGGRDEGMTNHTPSRADNLDNSQVQSTVFPPAPVSTGRQGAAGETYDTMMRGSPQGGDYNMGPMAANAVLGGSFGSSF